MWSRLQYISQGDTVESQLVNIHDALDAGCKWVQLRFKNATKEDWYSVAREVQIACQKNDAIFIVNDYVERAKELNADGVHVGLDDMSISDIRIVLGQDKIVGGTANTYENVIQRIEEGCDYIGLGPLRKTTTKKKLSPILGFDGYKEIYSQLEKNITPIVAIGSVTDADIEELMQIGLFGVAVSGQITEAKDKTELVKRFKTLLNE